MLSLVIPVYRNEQNLDRLLAELCKLQQRLPDELEVVFVVDGSPDRSLEILRERLPALALRSQLVSLSRNFGSFSAVLAGLGAGSGDQFAVLAADLQEPPELILQFHEALKNDAADIVFGYRTKRSDPWFSELTSNIFWSIYRKLVVPDMPKGGVDVFACSKKVRDQVLQFREVNTNLIALLFWMGFRRHYIGYERAPRQGGKSGWTFSKKLEYCLNSIFNFTGLPIRLLLIVGFAGSSLAVVAAVVVLIAKLRGDITVPGYTVTVLFILFFGGLITLGLGVVGQYLWLSLQNDYMEKMALTHLRALEAESIHILREVVAEFAKPVMLYSIGKDSSCMVRLAQKAFYPGKIPFPLLHVDTTYKFKEMIEFRDRFTKEIGAELIVHTNRKAIDDGANPFRLGTEKCCGLLKTRALLDALAAGGYDAAFGGARRDEEKSRAKERVYSFRDSFGQWDPKNQRPELWSLYNAKVDKGESIRVFPLSNWTELDVWQYIHLENIPIVPLYFAKERQMVARGGTLIPVEQDIPLLPHEKAQSVMCRMRSLGCSPCTGAIHSEADTVPKIIEEMMLFRRSERENRVIDHDREGSMEIKKREGYF